MKQFTIPSVYRSQLIQHIKSMRKANDKMKRDLTPTSIDFGPVVIHLARHFGFCYGVENAIEIAFRTIEQNPGKRIFLLSEMIHNPLVNHDLVARGVSFLQDTKGNELFPIDSLTAEDVVIIPAFGTTLEMEAKLRDKGIPIETYNTTCPFVEKVWNRSEQIAEKGYTVIVHGKPTHEETRATFSHAAAHTPTLVINDMSEAIELSQFIRGDKPWNQFDVSFSGRTSAGFDPEKDLKKIGVVNQTTMLASDTQAIADFLRATMIETFNPSEDAISSYVADTRDTLCYATNDNQSGVYGMLEQPADFAIVIGGYNSSNTSHLVELCEQKLPTYHIDHPDRLKADRIHHYHFVTNEEALTTDYLPKDKKQTHILLTSGASCPDALVEVVIEKLASYFVEENQYKSTINQILQR